MSLLENNWVRLDPLSTTHTDALWEVVKHLNIYKYGPNDLSTKDKLAAYITQAVENEKIATDIPFAVFNKLSQKYAGCTRFGLIDPYNKTLHIGWTWLATEVHGTGLNTALKHLMLSHAFGPMKMRKVIFRIDALNIRSRKAVEKLGATLEGILKEDVFVAHKRIRDTCCYAIFSRDYSSK
jgi:RimJ/RimL family protein N-acetyltransferase